MANKRSFELELQRARLLILKVARENDFPPDVIVAACANVVGMTASMLEPADGIAFEKRMEDFHELTRSVYREHRNTPSMVLEAMKPRS